MRIRNLRAVGLLFGAVCALAGAPGARAALSGALAANAPREVSVELPKASLARSSGGADQRGRGDFEDSTTRVEISARFLVPRNLQLASWTRDARSFSGTSWPRAGVGVVWPLLGSPLGELTASTSVGIGALSREGTIQVGLASRVETQTLFLVPASFGVGLEVGPALLRQWFAPGLSVYLQPMAAVLQPSALSEGRTLLALGYGWSVGGGLKLGRMISKLIGTRGNAGSWARLELWVGYAQEWARLEEGALNGSGGFLGLRAPI